MASIASFFKPKPAKRKADGDDTAASATPKKQATGAAASRKEGDQTDPAPAVTADPVATEVCSSARGRSGMPTRPPLRPRSSCAFFVLERTSVLGCCACGVRVPLHRGHHTPCAGRMAWEILLGGKTKDFRADLRSAAALAAWLRRFLGARCPRAHGPFTPSVASPLRGFELSDRTSRSNLFAPTTPKPHVHLDD